MSYIRYVKLRHTVTKLDKNTNSSTNVCDIGFLAIYTENTKYTNL